MNPARAQKLEQSLLAEPAAVLAADARRSGDAKRGAAIFYDRAMACSTCHSVGDRPDAVGPDLTKSDAPLSDVEMVEAILRPSKKIAPAFATVQVQTTDGRLIVGVPLSEDEKQLVLREVAQPYNLVKLPKAIIEERQATQQSLMPEGQVNQLSTRTQFLDLVSYLMEIRTGGPDRARQLQPAPDPYAMKFPDSPLPWQPVVQRGDGAVDGKTKYPQSVALGFTGGTVLFDANRLQVVALWFDGFLKHSPQNYFGLNWSQEGTLAEKFDSALHPLQFKLSEQSNWQNFELSATSDPNVGTRFDGYQIGKASVRLHYRVLVAGRRITVTEDIRAESRTEWRGFARHFTFRGLPAGAQVAFTLPEGSDWQRYDASGQSVKSIDDIRQAPLLGYHAGKFARVFRAQATDGSQWVTSGEKNPISRVTASATSAEDTVMLRLDAWQYRGTQPVPTAAELATLAANPPAIDEVFDRAKAPATPLPEVKADSAAPPLVKRPPVQPQENIDEFPATRGRYLRFVVTRTNDNTSPGIDELEVFGADPKRNLALDGKASASSVISGHAIHQIPHLNDGILGNDHSWISAERDAGWVQIEFPQLVEMQRIVWARDRNGKCKDRLATSYRIEVSEDGQNWKRVGDERGRELSGMAQVRRQATPGYVMETIPAPFPTWRPSDIVFGDDGMMYVLAMTEGQVWRARTPPPGHPEQVEWRRYACGLFHPTGLAFVDGRLFVSQKPEITELLDRDGDGIVDQYRTVATGWGLSSSFHEYTFGLAVDPQKNLWFALNTGNFWTHPGMVALGRWRGSILRIAQGSEKMEEIATGCRVPNGITQGPEGNIFFVDNQGDWIQVCKLSCVVPGRFYGHPETKAEALTEGQNPDGRCSLWLPYERCRSAAGPVHDSTRGGFGPFADQMFVGDVGYGANTGILRIALEKVNGEYQGACFPFIEGQPHGCQHMKFGPDQQLYMTSLTTGLTRLAYTGELPFSMKSIAIRPRGAGFVIKLTKPLAENTQLDSEQIRVSSHHYLYTGKYGSPKADNKNVPVEKVLLSADRTEITLTLPVETHPLGRVYEFQLGKLISAAGESLEHPQAWYTVHQIPK